jgi:hypothetical protein
MAHNRKLVLSGAALTMARNNRHGIRVMEEIMDELEHEILSTGYSNNAPFIWVGLSLRYGLKNEDKPHYQGIDEKDGEIALAIELDTHELQHASREELKDLFTIATLKALVDVGKKYNLPYERFEVMLREKQSARASRLP